ncbi:hypothetical protein CK203_073185 [Vitis vinifera]|uniref:Uncharacterized protein n=1 Tax=Vitis vinifera TaxID=29760 RepID=A0A438ENL0_VITVI|nr:hypothetical protein CK203_073185 [Vitis vinifera]
MYVEMSHLSSLLASAHTDCIIAEDLEVAEVFLRQVDRTTGRAIVVASLLLDTEPSLYFTSRIAAVFHNASTRFVMGLVLDLGPSWNKYKILRGNGQVVNGDKGDWVLLISVFVTVEGSTGPWTLKSIVEYGRISQLPYLECIRSRGFLLKDGQDLNNGWTDPENHCKGPSLEHVSSGPIKKSSIIGMFLHQNSVNVNVGDSFSEACIVYVVAIVATDDIALIVTYLVTTHVDKTRHYALLVFKASCCAFGVTYLSLTLDKTHHHALPIFEASCVFGVANSLPPAFII